MKIAVGITGASGVVYGIRLLEALRDTEHHVSLVLSEWGSKTIGLETSYTEDYVLSLADCVYDSRDMAAAVSSGSYGIDATVIAPCSMKTLAGIANGFSDDPAHDAAALLKRIAGDIPWTGDSFQLPPRQGGEPCDSASPSSSPD